MYSLRQYIHAGVNLSNKLKRKRSLVISMFQNILFCLLVMLSRDRYTSVILTTLLFFSFFSDDGQVNFSCAKPSY